MKRLIRLSNIFLFPSANFLCLFSCILLIREIIVSFKTNYNIYRSYKKNKLVYSITV